MSNSKSVFNLIKTLDNVNLISNLILDDDFEKYGLHNDKNTEYLKPNRIEHKSYTYISKYKTQFFDEEIINDFCKKLPPTFNFEVVYNHSYEDESNYISISISIYFLGEKNKKSDINYYKLLKNEKNVEYQYGGAEEFQEDCFKYFSNAVDKINLLLTNKFRRIRSKIFDSYENALKKDLYSFDKINLD